MMQTGPYAIVRHPIYSGMLAAACGMVIVLGEARALALRFGVGLLLKRIGMEEAVLRATFPAEYPGYERRVKRLLPGIGNRWSSHQSCYLPAGTPFPDS